MAAVEVEAKPRVSLIDEAVCVLVKHLLPGQQISLRAQLVGEKGERFESFAHYTADEHGTVCASSQPSVGGTYVGIEPMGLLWSMRTSPGQQEGLRLLKRDVTKPYVVGLDVFDGHVRLGGEEARVDEPLSSATFEKWYINPGVKRVPVREGRIRATLFLPPGDGPFPGVIDWFGNLGGLREMKASLLASHGFAALALAYLRYEDLPSNVEDVETEYFEEAAEWMLRQPNVTSGGVGVMSVSSGCRFALLLGIQRPDLVKAVVTVSPIAFSIPKQTWRLLQIEGYPKLQHGTDGSLISGKFYTRILEVLGDDFRQLIPVERLLCSVLYVYGGDDMNTCSEVMVKNMSDRMQKHGKQHLCNVLGYPGAGHLIEPPYTPHCPKSSMKNGGQQISVAWGGNSVGHAYAQEDSWFRILHFFRKNLTKEQGSHL